MMTDADLAAEYAEIAHAWGAFCKGLHSTVDNFSLAGHPLTVVLLAALAEPPRFQDRFTGDVVADALAGLATFVHHLDGDASEAGGARAYLHGYEIAGLSRRLAAVLTLRAYERLAERGGAL
jgi:hypothetical protein